MAILTKKAQIYISQDQWQKLKSQSVLKKVSVAQVIREAVDSYIKTEAKKNNFLETLKKTHGIWKDRKDIKEGQDLVREMRKEWDKRLERIISG